MKSFTMAETGNGKTALNVIFAQIYAQEYPNNMIYCNFHINLPNFYYTQFGFLPFSVIKKGNCLIELDDFGNLDNTKNYSTYLATICRKTNTDMLLTCQVHTQIQKSLRDMCDKLIIPYITNKIYNEKTGKWEMTFDSELYYDVYNPRKYDYYNPNRNIPLASKVIENPLECILGQYDTSELVDIPNERLYKQEIIKHSESLRDIELNIGIYSKNRNDVKRMTKEILKETDFT